MKAIKMDSRTIKKIICSLLLFLGLVHADAQGGRAPRTITIRAVPGMRFDPPRVKVEPGEKIRIVFSNADDMSHNLLITKPGSRVQVVEEALKLAEKGPEKNYIPDTKEILWAIPVVSPGEMKMLAITAPAEEGIYPYVCTFPGHGFVMYGALYVTRNALPDIQNDLNVPESVRELSKGPGAKHNHALYAFHPYSLSAPTLYRVFMPNAGPASFAVRVTDSLSYCWDSGLGRLLYAWKGDFIDNSVAWRGHVNAEAEILGEIFYQSEETCPLRPADANEAINVVFKGYTLKNGYPEFHYKIGAMEVYELIEPGRNPLEWTHRFKVSGAKKGVSFDTAGKGKYRIKQSAGSMKDNVLTLSSIEAADFSITYSF